MKSEAWSSLKLWPLQLLVERIVSSAGEPVTPGQALRHVFESIAGGIVLPGSPGILDPCEKEQIDALGYLGRQEREALTFSAQVISCSFGFCFYIRFVCSKLFA